MTINSLSQIKSAPSCQNKLCVKDYQRCNEGICKKDQRNYLSPGHKPFPPFTQVLLNKGTTLDKMKSVCIKSQDLG